MTQLGTTTIAVGKKALEALIEEISAAKLDWNEAETRFQIIDRVIVDCLGWSPRISSLRAKVRREELFPITNLELPAAQYGRLSAKTRLLSYQRIRRATLSKTYLQS